MTCRAAARDQGRRSTALPDGRSGVQPITRSSGLFEGVRSDAPEYDIPFDREGADGTGRSTQDGSTPDAAGRESGSTGRPAAGSDAASGSPVRPSQSTSAGDDLLNAGIIGYSARVTDRVTQAAERAAVRYKRVDNLTSRGLHSQSMVAHKYGAAVALRVSAGGAARSV
jgi:hypothetical protein